MHEINKNYIQSLDEGLRSLHVRVTTLDARMEQQQWQQTADEEDLLINIVITDDGHARGTEGRALIMKTMKLDVPRYSGEELEGWIFKADQYFNYCNVFDDQRLIIDSFHLDGAALAWY